MQFNELDISHNIKRAVKDMKYTEMTPIQECSIPPLLEGKDVIGLAKTGTGKTAAFAIPAIESADKELKNLQVLVLTPTRELAMQVCGEIRKFTKYIQGISCESVYGGDPIDRQIRALRRKPAIVIGTPGRVLDLINRRVLRLKTLKTIILDEADEMLNMGFRQDIEKVLTYTPRERQTVLFSATMPNDVLELAKTYQKDPVNIKIKADELTVKNIEQYYVDLPKNAKVKALEHLISEYKPTRSLIFCNTKRQVDKLLKQMKDDGHTVDGLHGDMSQRVRTNVMAKFKKGNLSVLIATDVAARGIDVKDIDIVFNYDIPADMDFYVHRIGRTARAGKSGLAITFSTGTEQLHNIFAIERFTNSKIKRLEIPDLSVSSSAHSDSAPVKQQKGRYNKPAKSGSPNKANNTNNNTKKQDSDKENRDHIINQVKRKGLPKPANTTQKISLDEYFKRTEEVNKETPRKNTTVNKAKDSPASNNANNASNNQRPAGRNAPVKANSIHKAKSRIKYNGYNGKK